MNDPRAEVQGCHLILLGDHRPLLELDAADNHHGDQERRVHIAFVVAGRGVETRYCRSA
jgi:hypothetical protein